MSICSAGVRTIRRSVAKLDSPVAELPAFLCPILLRTAHTRPRANQHNVEKSSRSPRLKQTRCLSTNVENSIKELGVSPAALAKLPRQCPGCGAHTQFVDKGEAGYYTLKKASTRAYLDDDVSREQEIIAAALKNAGDAAKGFSVAKPQTNEQPLCDRCHEIIHHSSGVSIHHPTPTAIQDTILESPHKYNHIYHIIDAADFPMSVIPQLQKLLHANPQRSHNRRAKSGKFYQGKQIEMSFIITRSDLLAAKKEQVDAMMPYLRETLRDALGRSGKDVRLGNVKCVSAQRQWWTSGLKEEIFKNGGGSWMVGKVNVGKSRLLHEIFPKGRREAGTAAKGYKDVVLEGKPDVAASDIQPSKDVVENDHDLNEEISLGSLGGADVTEPTILDTSSLLPPAPEEVDYPTMPIVSSLPGTTASPIRLSFGAGKGEMIDLPGLSRGDIELCVEPSYRASLVMKKRVEPKQQSLKPGQSLLLGGFIRITPTSDLTFLAYNFTPLKDHKTSTVKAIEVQNRGEEARNIENIASEDMAKRTKLAGEFHLKWDVTKQRAGPLTNSAMVGLKPERLSFKVMATDLLIEGVGWVEIVAQVRKQWGKGKVVQSQDETAQKKETVRESNVGTYAALGSSESTSISSDTPTTTTEQDSQFNYTPLFSSSPSTSTSTTISSPSIPPTTTTTSSTEWEPTPSPTSSNPETEEIDPSWPSFEVYTPDGKFVTTRRPMNAWMNVLAKPKKEGTRPRKSMKGMKKAEKRKRRGW